MSRLAQLRALSQTLLRHPDAARALARWKPFSITSFEMARALRRHGLRPATVLDAGANAGQFARAMAETFPEVHVHSFEALPDVAARFRRHLNGHPRVRLTESAVGSHDGTLRFYRHAYDLASSALPATPERAEEAAEEALDVPVARLDTLLADELLPRPVLLKLDLQGFEREALRGAPETLARTDHVLLEVAFRSSYVGEASFDELHALLGAAGFAFRAPVDVLREDGVITQMDALFERADR